MSEPSVEIARVNECEPGCTRDHAPCTRNRWLDAINGIQSSDCPGFPEQPVGGGFIDPQEPLARRLRALEAEVAELRKVRLKALPEIPEGLDPIVRALVEERVRRGMSQRDVVRALGCSSATVNTWERGISLPTLDHLREWAAVFGYEPRLSPGLPS